MSGLHTCYRWACSFHIGLWCKVLLCDISLKAVWCFCPCLLYFFSAGVPWVSCWWPPLDIYIVAGSPLDVLTLLLAVWCWNILIRPSMQGCWSHCIYKLDFGGYPTEDVNQCGWAFCKLWWTRFHLIEGRLKCPGKDWNHLVWILLW